MDDMLDEILFENIYTDTEDLMAEQYKKLFTSYRRLWVPIYSVLSVVFLLYVFLFGGVKNWLFLLIAISYLIYSCIRHRIAARQYMKNVSKFYENTIPETVHSFSGDIIYSVFGNQTFHVPLAKVDILTETDHLLILCIGKTHRMTLKKDSFTKGTYPEFLAFLRTKCPSLKIPE